MATIKCSLTEIKRTPVDKWDVLSEGVRLGLKEHPDVFTGTQPIKDADFSLQISGYTTARAKFVNGGKAQKKDYDDAAKKLKDTITKVIVPYVDKIANGDANIILLAGLVPTGQPKVPGEKLISEGVQPMMAEPKSIGNGAVEVDIDFFSHDATYFLIACESGPLPEGTVLSDNGQLIVPKDTACSMVIHLLGPRKKKITGLKPNVFYHLYCFAVCGNRASRLSAASTIGVR